MEKDAFFCADEQYLVSWLLLIGKQCIHMVKEQEGEEEEEEETFKERVYAGAVLGRTR